MNPSLSDSSDTLTGFSIKSDQSLKVLIAIPTFQRSGALLHVLKTLQDRLVTRHKVSLLIVDNNPTSREELPVRAFAETSDIPVHYIHEPSPGVSNARNAAIAFADTQYLAFLDDDMEITANWLDEMIKTSRESGCGVIFGPIVARFEDVADPRNPYLAPYYSRTMENQQTVEIKKPFGTGGCLIDLSQGERPEPCFDPNLNESGGEDDMFFSALSRSGVKFGWAKRALCFENVPNERITNTYIMRRNIGYGQAPTRMAATRGISGLIQIMRHMVIGAAQFGVYGSLYFAASLLKRPSSVRYLALTSRGFGKVFWGNRFQQKLYGASQLSS